MRFKFKTVQSHENTEAFSELNAYPLRVSFTRLRVGNFNLCKTSLDVARNWWMIGNKTYSLKIVLRGCKFAIILFPT